METTYFVEHMLYKRPEIRNLFLSLNIMSMSRKISSKEHEEYNHLLSNFENEIKVISIVGIVQVTFLISMNKIGRLYEIVIIRGNDFEVTQMSKTLLVKELISILNWKDFLPEPFVKKIIYINKFNENKINGVVFSEFSKNKWTLEDPTFIEVKNYRKTTGRVIINEVVNDFL